jgi:hypothetical protein
VAVCGFGLGVPESLLVRLIKKMTVALFLLLRCEVRGKAELMVVVTYQKPLIVARDRLLLPSMSVP